MLYQNSYALRETTFVWKLQPFEKRALFEHCMTPLPVMTEKGSLKDNGLVLCCRVFTVTKDSVHNVLNIDVGQLTGPCLHKL
jgi:hypothetical protein